MRNLGIGAYRFSVSWPRIFPEGEGAPNPAGIGFYNRLVDGLLDADITPWVCLHHWDMPEALQRNGGWLTRDTVEHFLDYTVLVKTHLGDRVRHWIPLNEPNVAAYGGYGSGVFPPGHMNEEFFFAAAHLQNLAQGKALKALSGDGHLAGCIVGLSPVRPASGARRDIAAAKLHDLVMHRIWLDPLLMGRYPTELAHRIEPLIEDGDLEDIQHRPDFVGVNYYGPEYRRAWLGAPFSNDGNVEISQHEVTEGQRAIDADGLLQLLVEVRERYGNLPIVITENGASFADALGKKGEVSDPRRVDFLRAHLASLHQAIAQGCDVRGYFVWSLLDNWEWTWGHDQRFGLVYVDFEMGNRLPKYSFDWYRSVVRANGVSP